MKDLRTNSSNACGRPVVRETGQYPAPRGLNQDSSNDNSVTIGTLRSSGSSFAVPASELEF
jgi:hypothetical protein